MPGLFCGSIASMADIVHLPSDEILIGLDQLREHELVEYDQKMRVLRLTELPDCGESPTNGKVIRSWYTSFRKFPQCGVRDAHVPTLRWLMEEWSRSTGKPISKDHETVWLETFGQVAVPAPRKRGVRKLLDSDTGTAAQPSLFSSPSKALPPVSEPYADGTERPSYPQQSTGEVGSVVSSDLEQNQTSGKGIAYPMRYPQDHGSLITDPGSSSQGGSGGKPALALVPPVGPFTVDDLHGLFTEARAMRWPPTLRQEQRAELERAIGDLRDVGPGDLVLALLRDWMRRGGTLAGISPEQLAQPGVLRAAIQDAVTWRRDSEAKSAALREARERLGLPT